MIVELLLFGALLVGVYFLLHMTVLKLPRCTATTKLHGKTVIITGANTGIGKTTAIDLARRGARVILACRDKGRGEAAVQEIVQETGNKQVIFMQLDLASLKSVRSFDDSFLKSEPRLDILINNAANCATPFFTHELAKRLEGTEYLVTASTLLFLSRTHKDRARRHATSWWKVLNTGQPVFCGCESELRPAPTPWSKASSTLRPLHFPTCCAQCSKIKSKGAETTPVAKKLWSFSESCGLS
ncbi:dehydrogenase/reductase SDR family member 13-like protein [Lates japonicus]|uniref:Dehydrogenase/reductase SDR family member 13-like protein n=1 Tax=Lates japonicus TaxID=270547 RepID=A0AAD3RIL1_LATJO|nr:dehydrogenase/reductase SDR family member 13-like protein [Lates japonicus]